MNIMALVNYEYCNIDCNIIMALVVLSKLSPVPIPSPFTGTGNMAILAPSIITPAVIISCFTRHQSWICFGSVLIIISYIL